MRKSRGFYSIYLFILLLFISVGIGRYFYMISKNKHDEVSSHILSQMLIYEKSIKEVVKVCLKKYGLNMCKRLKIDLGDRFLARSVIQQGALFYIVDFSVEYQNPLTSLMLRKSKREIWKIKQS